MEPMGALLTEIVVESTDPAAAATFWSRTLGWDLHEHLPGNVPWISASGDPDGHDLKLVFVPVRAGKTPANRLYLNPQGCDLPAEIGRLTALGATTEAGASTTPWVAMVDPGGTRLTILPTRID
ncbi:MAG TPA: VOC family protein [Acidimicrobiales bacterium]|nr:VOC family protein [Acidimicrobiales bacterium]